MLTRNVLFAAALVLASHAAAAQSRPLLKRAPPAVRQATLDLATGTYTRGPITNERGGTTVADFTNLDTVGWLAVDTGNGICRWFNNGSKGVGPNQPGNASDLISDVVFFYCSNELDVLSGGAGGSVTLGFYEGYTVFGGAPTTVAAIVPLTGMPANTSDGSFFTPGSGCFGLRVIFPSMIAFADQTFIGYSWRFDDVGTDGTLASTVPFIACVASCTATGFTPDGQGMVDALTKDCTNGVSYSFSIALGTQTASSTNLEIREASDLATTNVHYNASVTPNADTLSATNATLGSTWTATLTRAAVSPPGNLLLTLRQFRHPFPNGGNPTGLVTGRVLIAGPTLATLAGTHDGTSGSISAAVPPVFGFCGLHFAAQCRTSGAGFQLSSGVEGTIGTF